MKTLLSVALTVCAMLGLSRSASGDMIIDLFNETSQSVQDFAVDSDTSDTDPEAVTSEVDAPEAIGEVRFISTGLTSGVFTETEVTDLGASGTGIYQAPGSKGIFSFGYDGIDDNKFDADTGTPGIFFDLSGMNELGITALTQGSTTFGLLATLYNGAAAYSKEFTVSGSSSHEYRVSLDDLVASNPLLDLAHITGIKISDDPGFDYDLNQSVTLSKIRTFQTPEPSSMILLTLTGMGFAGATWRRRRKLALAA